MTLYLVVFILPAIALILIIKSIVTNNKSSTRDSAELIPSNSIYNYYHSILVIQLVLLALFIVISSGEGIGRIIAFLPVILLSPISLLGVILSLKNLQRRHALLSNWILLILSLLLICPFLPISIAGYFYQLK